MPFDEGAATITVPHEEPQPVQVVVVEKKEKPTITSWVGPWASLEERIADTAKYKPGRLALALAATQLLTQHGVEWFLEGGTLLGAFRDGKMLAHDDDFDLAFCLSHQELEALGGADAYLTQLAATMDAELQKVQAPAGTNYRCRPVLSYCKKIEMYDANSGHYPLVTADSKQALNNFHNVTVDLTLLVAENDGSVCRHTHRTLPHVAVPRSALQPHVMLEYEGTMWNVPREAEVFLTSCYGYLGKDAVFDPATSLYRKRRPDEQ